MKLLTKLILIFIVSALLFIGIIGYFGYGAISDVLENKIGQNQVFIASNAMSKIDRLLYERLLNIQMVASNKLVSDFAKLSNKKLTLEDEDGQADVFNEYLAIKKELASELEDYLVLSGPWNKLEIKNLNGDIVISTDPEKHEKTEEGEFETEIFNKVVSGELYYSDAVLDKDGQVTILFGAPIRDNDQVGKPIIGVAIGHLAWPAMLEILTELPGHSYLYNSQGFLIGAKALHEGDKYLKTNHSDYLALYHAFDGESMSMRINSIYGVDSLISHVPQLGYLGYKGNNWTLVLEVEVQEAFKEVPVAARRLLLVLLSLVVAIVIIFNILIYFSIITPIKKLTNTAREISGGNLKERAKVKSKDEIGQLAQTLNVMTDNLVQMSKQSQAVIETFPEPLFILDKEGKVTSLNKAAAEATGYSEGELKGKSIKEVLAGTQHKNMKTLKHENKDKEVIKYIPDPEQFKKKKQV